jgi:hypothetical protein
MSKWLEFRSRMMMTSNVTSNWLPDRPVRQRTKFSLVCLLCTPDFPQARQMALAVVEAGTGDTCGMCRNVPCNSLFLSRTQPNILNFARAASIGASHDFRSWTCTEEERTFTTNTHKLKH